MTDSTLRSLDSDFRWPAEGGVEYLRDMIGGETDRGGVEVGEGIAAHSVDSDEYIAPLLVFGSQDAILSETASAESSSECPATGLGDDDCVVMIDNGARMLKIWSSACGGP